MSEADIQSAIKQGLQMCGFIVMSTSRVRRRCRCGRFAQGGDGCDKGLPDLFFRHPHWPQNEWSAIEVKGQQTKVSPEQHALASAGAYVICRDPLEAVNYARKLHEERLCRTSK